MPATPSLDSVVSWIDAYLKIRELPDHDGAVNGLQVENGGSITRVLAAVDASIDSIATAARQRGTLLLVHHGLFWGDERSVTGRRYRRLKTALDGDVAVYSAHLPLDAHPEVGNNILLAQLLGLAVSGPFAPPISEMVAICVTRCAWLYSSARVPISVNGWFVTKARRPPATNTGCVSSAS